MAFLDSFASFATEVELTPAAEAKQTVLAAVLGWPAETTIDVEPGKPALYIGAATKVDARLALPSLAKARGLGRVGIYDVDPSTGQPGRVIKHWTRTEGMVVVSPVDANGQPLPNGSKPAPMAPGQVTPKASPAPKAKATPKATPAASPAPATEVEKTRQFLAGAKARAEARQAKASPVAPAPAILAAEASRASLAATIAPKASPVAPAVVDVNVDLTPATGILGWLAGLMSGLALWFAGQAAGYVRASQARQTAKATRLAARHAASEARQAKLEATRQAKATRQAEAWRQSNPGLAAIADTLAAQTAILAHLSGQATPAPKAPRQATPVAPVAPETPTPAPAAPKAKASPVAPVASPAPATPAPAPATTPVDVDPAPAILAASVCQRPGCDSGQPAVSASAGTPALYCPPCIAEAKAIAARALAAKTAPASPVAPVATPKASPAPKGPRTDEEWTAAVASPCTACGQFSLDGPVCRECQSTTPKATGPAPKAAPAPKANVTPSSPNGQASPAPKAAGMPASVDVNVAAELAATEAMCRVLEAWQDVHNPAARPLCFARGAEAYQAVAKRAPGNMALSLILTHAQGAIFDARAVKAASETVQATKASHMAAEGPQTAPGNARADALESAKFDRAAHGPVKAAKAGQADLFAEMQDAAKAEAIALAAEVKAAPKAKARRQTTPADPATRAAEVDASNALHAARQATSAAYAEGQAAGLTPAECREHAGLPPACQHTSEVDRAWCPACDHDKRLAASQATPVDTTPTPKAASPVSLAEGAMCPAEGCDKRASVCPQHRAAPKGASIVDVPVKAKRVKASAAK